MMALKQSQHFLLLHLADFILILLLVFIIVHFWLGWV